MKTIIAQWRLFLFTALFCLTAPTDVQAKLLDYSGKTSEGIFTPGKSHRGYLEKISFTLDYDAIGTILTHSPASYRYFTPTGNGIRVRQGTNTKYKEHYRISKSAANSKEKNVILGGIIGKKSYKGNKDCSAWHEILAVRIKGKKDLQPSISLFSQPEYICKDFIKVESKNPYLSNFLQSYFTYATVKDKYLSKPVKLSKNITLMKGSIGDFVRSSSITLKAGDRIAFWPRKHGQKGLSSDVLPICRLVNNTHALYVGTLPLYEIEKKLPLSSAQDKKTLRDWLRKYYK